MDRSLQQKLRLLFGVYGFEVLYRCGDDGGTPEVSDIGRPKKNELPRSTLRGSSQAPVYLAKARLPGFIPGVVSILWGVSS
jgi:hypothetical protein